MLRILTYELNTRLEHENKQEDKMVVCDSETFYCHIKNPNKNLTSTLEQSSVCFAYGAKQSNFCLCRERKSESINTHSHKGDDLSFSDTN